MSFKYPILVVLESLSDDMPKTNRYAISIFPSVIPNCGADDVITSPYNAMLSLAKLHDFADSVIPFDNGKLAQLSVCADIGSTRNPNFRNFLENQRQATGYMDSKCLEKGRYINKNTKVPGRRVSAGKIYGNQRHRIISKLKRVKGKVPTQVDKEGFERINDPAAIFLQI